MMTGNSLALTDRIKTPKPVKVLTGMLIPLIFLSLSPSPDPDRHIYLYYIRLVWIGVCIVGCLCILINALRKENQLQWGTDSLIIRKNRISASGVKAIYVDGPLVGILPAGKRIVPVHLSFRFTEDPAGAKKRLIIWAKENGIRLETKKFVRWV